MRALLILTAVWLVGQFATTWTSAGRDDRDERRGLEAAEMHAVLSAWPDRSREVARRVIAEHGRPDGATADLMWWEDDGEVGIVVYRDDPRAQRALAAATGARRPAGEEGRR